MKRRICDLIIGQVMMGIMLIIMGIAYEGISYSNFNDIAPYIQLAVIVMVFSVPVSVMVFKTAIDGIGYLRTKKTNIKEISEAKEAEA